MTNAEINHRLAGMSPALIERVKRMIREGYGARGIAASSPATLRQANAVFQRLRTGSAT